MCPFCPDFRKMLKNLSDYKRELDAQRVDNIYGAINKIINDRSLDENDIERLIEKHMEGVHQPEKCSEAIMRTIWPPPRQTQIIVFNNAKVTDPASLSDPKLEKLAEAVEQVLGVKTTNLSVFRVIDSNSTIVMDSDHLIIEKEGRAVPLLGKLCGQHPVAHSGGSHDAKQNPTAANSPNTLANDNTANKATQTSPSGGPSTSNPPGSVPGSSHTFQPPGFSSSMNRSLDSGDDEAFSQHSQPSGTGHHQAFGSLLGGGSSRGQTAPRGHTVPHGQIALRGHTVPHPHGHSGPLGNTAPHGHTGPLGNIAPRGQPALRGRGRGGPRGRGSAFSLNPSAEHRSINFYPMSSGRELKRTYAMTELSDPGAQRIILGPLPPPTLPPHVRTSTLPPGHPPQSYGPGAFPPSHNLPGPSSSNYNSGATSEITEQVASASNTQPAVSAQSPDSSESLNKRSRDDQDDEEETTRPSTRLRIEAPPESSPPDDTAADAVPTLASSGNGEGSSDNGSPKKRTRYAEEDEDEVARPSTRMRQSPPAVRPRYSSPTPSDRRIGRIIAPFGTSTRFNPRPSPEADIGSLSATRNEGNTPNNLPASSSGSSTLPSASSESSSASRSSQRIKEQKAKK